MYTIVPSAERSSNMSFFSFFAKFTTSFMKGSVFMKFKKIEIEWKKITNRKTNKKV